MNSPFGPRSSGDFTPKPVQAFPNASERDKENATRVDRADFTPKPQLPKKTEVIQGPKEQSPTPASTAEVPIDTAHPAVEKGKSSETGATTPPALKPPTPKSSSPAHPQTPSKPSDSA